MIFNKIKQFIIQITLLICFSLPANAGGPLGIDHQLTRSDTGV